MDNVFKPVPGSKQQRIDNALKIDKFIKGKLSADATTVKNTSDKKSDPNYTMYPNPAKSGNMVTIKISSNILPIDSIDLKIYEFFGPLVDEHRWNNVQQGILKFEAPSKSGTYILKINTGDSSLDHDLKLMVM